MKQSIPKPAPRYSCWGCQVRSDGSLCNQPNDPWWPCCSLINFKTKLQCRINENNFHLIIYKLFISPNKGEVFVNLSEPQAEKYIDFHGTICLILHSYLRALLFVEIRGMLSRGVIIS